MAVRQPNLARQLRKLSKSFAIVELRDCTRQQGEAFGAWLCQFAVPVESLPRVTSDVEKCQSIERDGVFLLPFFDWWVEGESVVGRPVVPNDTESGLPRDPTVGFRIPLDEMHRAPNVKRKQGERDADGYVVIGY